MPRGLGHYNFELAGVPGATPLSLDKLFSLYVHNTSTALRPNLNKAHHPEVFALGGMAVKHGSSLKIFEGDEDIDCVPYSDVDHVFPGEGLLSSRHHAR